MKFATLCLRLSLFGALFLGCDDGSDVPNPESGQDVGSETILDSTRRTDPGERPERAMMVRHATIIATACRIYV